MNISQSNVLLGFISLLNKNFSPPFIYITSFNFFMISFNSSTLISAFNILQALILISSSFIEKAFMSDISKKLRRDMITCFG